MCALANNFIDFGFTVLMDERPEADVVCEFSDIGRRLETAPMTAKGTADRIAAELTERAFVINPGNV